MQKVICLFAFLLITGHLTTAQSIDKIINAAEVERIESVLSADDMEGRATFSPGIDKAADFIAAEFRKAGIQPVQGDSYFQEFVMLSRKFISVKGELNGRPFTDRNIAVFSTQPELNIDHTSGYEKIKVGAGDNLYSLVQEIMDSDKNYLLIVDSSQRSMFNSLRTFRPTTSPVKTNIVALLTSVSPDRYNIAFRQEVTAMPLKNVVGVLPGKKKGAEYVIFSAHYDHLGIRKPNADGDSIYNGANDDASGTTAVIMLANYFAKKKNNERTLVFAAFTAEEVGGYGSKHFSQQYDPEKVVAMFNIEMIGTDSKWGNNSAFITGYEKSDMGEILQKNLEKTAFKFYPDPYPQQNLFYRSDNATLARLGVPAHTISTSKMDSEKFYHTADDEIETLDMKNMAEIIKAIALSSASIIAGKDTPSRVDASQLRD